MSSKDRSNNRNGSSLVHIPDPGTSVAGAIWGAGAAEKTYAKNNFDPRTADSGHSFTPGRVAKHLFNSYLPTPEYKVFGYLSDWGIYDSRYGEYAGDERPDFSVGGRGTDIMRLLPPAGQAALYDKIIVGFTAIIGDQGELELTINQAALDFKIAANEADLPNQRGKATFTDPWADVAAYINCGFAAWKSNDYPLLFNPREAQGVLGALVKLHQRLPELSIGLSLGGWTMSEAFHHIAKEPLARERLADSLLNIFTTFPMFKELDLDWEYPGVPGAPGNEYGPEDAANYAELIKAIKIKLPNVKVSIATIAAPEKLEQANIPLLIDAGVEGLNVMTYDFFGSPWAEKLMHHTNLYRDPNDPTLNSVNDAVTYLLGLGINSKKIYIGYAGYTRNAQQATVSRISPLRGRYNPRQPDNDNTIGTFGPGVTEWPDLLRLYLDENLNGINGFDLYRDDTSKAEFLYNQSSQVFMSLDTPWSVRAKAEYVKEKNLGGMFTWMIDLDNGLLTNAVKEGLGAKLAAPPIVDMTDLYTSGKKSFLNDYSNQQRSIARPIKRPLSTKK
ncbi:Chitinase [Pseudomonas chlororaphis]|uniref:chitinase n=1 Tax=Pseudomonas chlororaphis TaxID=587753 RepID=A0A3G7TTC4_9PSED|nr:glycosyl hydrolase family 18 protein [Pseudomonas chlororaphis]AZE50394.1 Chitinase [Pseudomonas chlororaphis]